MTKSKILPDPVPPRHVPRGEAADFARAGKIVAGSFGTIAD